MHNSLHNSLYFDKYGENAFILTGTHISFSVYYDPEISDQERIDVRHSPCKLAGSFSVSELTMKLK